MSADDPLLDQLSRSRDLGFLGDGPLEQHVEHSSVLLAALADLVGPDRVPQSLLIDLGSGGGLPGLVALGRFTWSMVVMVDRSERRCAFLRSAVTGMNANDRAQVIVSEAELLGRDEAHREQYGAVIARSFGPPAATLECASGLVALGGHILISDPPGGREWPEGVCGDLGVRVSASSHVDPAWTVFEKVEPLAERYPRRAGMPARRPLFEA